MQDPQCMTAAERERTLKIVGHLSHDLKAPVRALGELVDWIEDELSDLGVTEAGNIADYLNLLKSRSKRVQTLIENLTIYAGVGLSLDPFDGKWDVLFKRAKSNIPQLENFDVSSRFDAVPKISSTDLTVLISCLLGNAVKHHHLGRGTIHVSARPNSNGCLISVQDDGPGIALDEREKAMALLETLERQDITEGSGLGLPIASSIAQHFGGLLSIGDVSDGPGCKVLIWLPERR